MQELDPAVLEQIAHLEDRLVDVDLSIKLAKAAVMLGNSEEWTAVTTALADFIRVGNKKLEITDGNDREIGRLQGGIKCARLLMGLATGGAKDLSLLLATEAGLQKQLKVLREGR